MKLISRLVLGLLFVLLLGVMYVFPKLLTYVAERLCDSPNPNLYEHE